ncbi:hypothetical protein CEXT_194951 [Caerostris extrusa]|uniref:Uncharacterized protein n=1 Tax=Caerostris extrusa TaxID=172846 RepID=A0AAV4M7E2_CAEEX|nr:hypothetical protein CEXT_194951 [Caerostris extrusa]
MYPQLRFATHTMQIPPNSLQDEKKTLFFFLFLPFHKPSPLSKRTFFICASALVGTRFFFFSQQQIFADFFLSISGSAHFFSTFPSTLWWRFFLQQHLMLQREKEKFLIAELPMQTRRRRAVIKQERGERRGGGGVGGSKCFLSFSPHFFGGEIHTQSSTISKESVSKRRLDYRSMMMNARSFLIALPPFPEEQLPRHPHPHPTTGKQDLTSPVLS